MGGTDDELLVSLAGIRGQHVVRRGQPILSLPRWLNHHQRVVLLVVIGVIDEDSEHHAAKQLLHVQQVEAILRHASAPQQLRKTRVAQLRLLTCDGLRAQRGTCRDAVDAHFAAPVETAHRQRVFTDEWHHLRFGYCDASQFGKCHGRVLDERHVDGLVVEKLDDPLLTVDVDERFGLGPAETAASGQQSALDVGDWLLGTDLMDDFAKLLRLRQPRQRALGARDV